MEHKKNYLVYLAVEDILPHPKNPRKELGDLTEMAESVKANGIMQNLTVVEVGDLPSDRIVELGITAEDIDQGRYMVVIGHRRLAAANLAGLSEVPCVISDMSYEDQLATMVTENLQRTDLTPVEQAQGLRQLSMELGLGAAQIAEKTGISESTVRRRLKVAAIAPEQLEKAAKGKQISIGDLEKVGEINDEELRQKALDSIGTHNFDWQISNAKKVEKVRGQQAAWREVMDEMAIREISRDEKYCREWTCMVKVPLSSKPCGDKFFEAKADGRIKPEWEIGWCFDDYPDEVKLYAKTQETPAEDPGKTARKEEYNARYKSVQVLKKEFDELMEKRLCFVCGLTASEAEKVFGKFMAGAVDFWARYSGMSNVDDDDLMDVLGNWEGEGEDLIDEAALADVLKDSERHPVQTAVWVLYRSIERDLWNKYPFETYQYDDGKSALTMGNYKDGAISNRLKQGYKLLEDMGYEVDPWERALLDGTSHMYYENGNVEPEEVKAGVVADEPQPIKTRFVVYQTMTEEELTAEIGDGDNEAGDFVRALLEKETPEDVAEECGFFCPCDVTGERSCMLYNYECGPCITEWLNEPYGKEGREE